MVLEFIESHQERDSMEKLWVRDFGIPIFVPVYVCMNECDLEIMHLLKKNEAPSEYKKR